MPETKNDTATIKGLSLQRIFELQQQYGKNIFLSQPRPVVIGIIADIVREPMFILLVIACSLYFILGETGEGIMMLFAMIIVAAISLYQQVRSNNAINALKQFSQPRVKVLRGEAEQIIPAEELVPGDIMLLEEGMNVPADAVILRANDCTVNESIITGESFPVEKSEEEGHCQLFQGTTLNSGKSTARVTAIGNSTVLGRLGKSIEHYHTPKTLLQTQINLFVRKMAYFGFIAFVLIFLVNFLHNRSITNSLLFSLTLAMSVIPEEIPVAFSSFMALGAYKMSKLGIISRQPQIIENLGAVSVICVDKTGTITENSMQLKSIYDFETDKLHVVDNHVIEEAETVLRYAVLASERDPFDAMEKAIVATWREVKGGEEINEMKMIFEYPLDGIPPMMTHVYERGGTRVVAAKGACERILTVCKMSDKDQQKIQSYTRSLAAEGYRVIAVASSFVNSGHLPERQDDFNWQFRGLLALYDPPKKNIRNTVLQFQSAQIEVKMLTGDYPETAMNIAGQVGIEPHLQCITGSQVMDMNQDLLTQALKTSNVFARMFPDAKLKVIEALKANGEIVAMTGDGVNDGPALKAANIGIAMGKRGTEIARQASDLVLTDDKIENLLTAISEGRKIFNNLKKAVRYIVAIHIPIILVASLPVILGWVYPNIFTPIHVIFLELIMGPTCSIFFEREPVEEDLMIQSPRNRNGSLFSLEELSISFIQGLMIAAGVLLLYYFFMKAGRSLEEVRTIVFTTLIISNVFLTFASRSFTRNILYSSRYRNNLAPVLVCVSALFLAAIHFLPAVQNIFKLAAISSGQFWLCFGVSFLSVIWFEMYKTNLPQP